MPPFRVPKSAAPPSRISARRIARSVLGFLLLVALGFLLLYGWSIWRIAALREAAIARGEPWTLRDLVSDPVLPEEDAAPLYRQAIAAFKLADAKDLDSSIGKDFERIRDLNIPFTGEEVAKGRETLERYRECLKLVDAAAGRTGFQWWRRLEDGEIVVDTDGIFFTEDFLALLTLRSRLALEGGDVAAALGDARHMLRMVQCQRELPSMIELLVSSDITIQSVHLIAVALRRSQLPDDVLHDTRVAVEGLRGALADPKRPFECWRAERLRFYKVILEGGLLSPSEQLWVPQAARKDVLLGLKLPEIFCCFARYKQAEELQGWESALAAYDGRPIVEVLRDLAAISEEHAERQPDGSRSGIFVCLDDAAQSDATIRSLLDLIRIALILYPQRPWPEDDASLARVLGEVPTDPLTGQPFRYWRHDRGFELMHPDVKTNREVDGPGGYPWRFAYQP